MGSVIALATSNGTGMGHLSRQLAVGTALGSSQDRVEPVYFSLSRAIGVIEHDGRRGEYCPSRERGWMPAVRWNDYLRERLTAFVQEAGAMTLAFDGVVPYDGLMLARAALPDVAFAWMRRGFWRAGVRTAPLESARLFDAVLEPGDLASDGDHGPTASLTDAVRLPPISQLEHLPLLPRAQAAEALGLDPERPTALVTLSSGVLNDVVTPGAAAVQALLEDEQWQVAVVRSSLAVSTIPLGDRCIELRRVYPLAQYLNAFDAAVAAGGYNSVHELLYAGVPTLFVPNPTSGTDDQQARTKWLADQGYARYAEPSDLDAIAAQARGLHDAAVRKDVREACATLPRPTGSAAAATELLKLQASGGLPAKDEATLRAKSAAIRLLGPRGTGLVRKSLGRPPVEGPTTRLNVPREGLFTESFDGILDADRPVEHLLPGSGPDYRRKRAEIASRYYEVQ